jgi:hypothetical protein
MFVVLKLCDLAREIGLLVMICCGRKSRGLLGQGNGSPPRPQRTHRMGTIPQDSYHRSISKPHITPDFSYNKSRTSKPPESLTTQIPGPHRSNKHKSTSPYSTLVTPCSLSSFVTSATTTMAPCLLPVQPFLRLRSSLTLSTCVAHRFQQLLDSRASTHSTESSPFVKGWKNFSTFQRSASTSESFLTESYVLLLLSLSRLLRSS